MWRRERRAGGCSRSRGTDRRAIATGRVIVVGAGIGGLACAWRLQRAGHEVELLERERVAGGRMRSEQRGDFVVVEKAAECALRQVRQWQ